MAHVPNLCLLLSLFSFTGQQSEMPQWQRITDEDESFTIRIPGKHTQTIKEKTIAQGVKLRITHYIAKPQGGRLACLFSFSEVEDGVAAPESAQNRLNRVRGQFSRPGHKILKEENVRLKNHPGVKLLIDMGKNRQMRVTIYATRNRLYQQIVIGSKKGIQSPTANRFLDSLQLDR